MITFIILCSHNEILRKSICLLEFILCVAHPTGDEVVQLYVQQPEATVPVPNIRLADFERVEYITPGESRIVSLTLRPEFHAVVYDSPNVYNATVAVEKGMVHLHVGGGQPDFYPGALHADIQVKNTQHLSTC